MNIDKMKSIGGREWIKGDYHRIYFNLDFMADCINLDLDFYKTGNICSARLDGERISNCQAKRILTKLDGKFWYDVKTESFMIKEVDRDYAKQIEQAILDKIQITEDTMELAGVDHKEQLDRQIKWQTIRNDFYGNMMYESKNAAAHERAYAGSGNLRGISRAGELTDRCRTASEFYHHVVLPLDAKIKIAQRSGDAALHKELLDEAATVVAEMADYTNLALSHTAL